MLDKPRRSDTVAQQPLGEAAELGRGRIARTPSASFHDLEANDQHRYCHFWRVFHQQVYVVTLAVKHLASIFRHKDQMDVHLENAVLITSNFVVMTRRLKYNRVMNGS